MALQCLEVADAICVVEIGAGLAASDRTAHAVQSLLLHGVVDSGESLGRDFSLKLRTRVMSQLKERRLESRSQSSGAAMKPN
jgi:hypothetical protein